MQLCGVEAGAVLYSSFEQGPIVWPSVEGMQQTIATLKNMPDFAQTRGVVDHDNFLEERSGSVVAAWVIRGDIREKKRIKPERRNVVLGNVTAADLAATAFLLTATACFADGGLRGDGDSIPPSAATVGRQMDGRDG
nr:agamous-like MADS-box protein AGL80 [Ipomoea batatas]